MRRNTLLPALLGWATVSGYDADPLSHFYPDICPIFSTALTVLIWAADQPDPGRAVEEVCDRVAARLLLPPELMQDVMGDGQPTAADIMTLYSRSRASRQVCAIAVSERLGCRGFVCILDSDTGVVQFSSRVGDTQPYAWRGNVVAATHLMRSAAI